MTDYIYQPDPNLESLPRGIPYIVANEAAERFSYYGMRAILVVFMTQYLCDSTGKLAVLSEQEAQGYYHLFVSSVYFMPVFGALLSDGFLGKYNTIILLSIVYCLGHFALAMDNTQTGLLIGQSLIACGAGGIKPCVSAHLGDQFGPRNRHLIGKIFSWFYFAINLGAFAAMITIPWMLENFGASLAFGIPGLLMLIATIVFWSGRYTFVHIKPSGSGFFETMLSREGFQSFAKLASIYIFVAIFWSLFEQIGSSWVLQAEKMDRMLFSIELLPSQIQAANPLLIMLLTPLFTYGVYPLLNKVIVLTDLRKIGVGFLLTVTAFSISSLIQVSIDFGFSPTILWQILAYIFLTSAEVMVSITCLEFSYRQAPKSMKSFVMAYYYLSVAVGNLFTSAVNFFIHNTDGTSKLAGADYFWFFTMLMGAATLIYFFVSAHFQRISYFDYDRE